MLNVVLSGLITGWAIAIPVGILSGALIAGLALRTLLS